jgi:hypothetical protein
MIVWASETRDHHSIQNKPSDINLCKIVITNTILEQVNSFTYLHCGMYDDDIKLYGNLF